MKRCKICIYPDTVPGISFDDEGVCNFCQDYKPIQYLGEDEFLKHVRDAKEKRCRYDCIVPISGGRDSTYVLHMAKTKYDLNALAVNNDNEFRVPQAFQNIKNACEILDVDLVAYRSNKNLAKKIVKQSIKKNLKSGIQDMLAFCMACTYGFRAVTYKTAIKHQVPLILWGGAKIENTTHMNPILYKKTIFQYWWDKFNPFSLDNLKLLYYRYLQRIENHVPGNLYRDLILDLPRLKDPNIKEIRFYDYIPWDRNRIKETITSQLKWKKPEDSITTWRIDCELEKLVTFGFHNIFGCSKYCFGFHNMINEHQIDRDEALITEEKTNPDLSPELEKLLLHDIGLSIKEIEKIRSFNKARPPVD